MRVVGERSKGPVACKREVSEPRFELKGVQAPRDEAVPPVAQRTKGSVAQVLHFELLSGGVNGDVQLIHGSQL